MNVGGPDVTPDELASAFRHGGRQCRASTPAGPDTRQCRATGLVFCTRPDGHDGSHAAGTGETIGAVWGEPS